METLEQSNKSLYRQRITCLIDGKYQEAVFVTSHEDFVKHDLRELISHGCEHSMPSISIYAVNEGAAWVQFKSRKRKVPKFLLATDFHDGTLWFAVFKSEDYIDLLARTAPICKDLLIAEILANLVDRRAPQENIVDGLFDRLDGIATALQDLETK